MKGKVIYVDFASRTKKVTYTENPAGRSLLSAIKEKLKSAFSFGDEPVKSKKEVYTFKHMM